MRGQRLSVSGVLTLALVMAGGRAVAVTPQTPIVLPTQADALPAPVAAAAESVAATVPALTPVDIVIDSDLGSATSTSGAMFPLHLGQPIVIDGKTLVPAGTSGVGEVIWAKKAGGSGSPGELVLAARYLDFGGRRLRLRSMNFQSVGDSRYKTVNSIMIASAAAVPGVALVGFAIKGKETTFAAGTLAHAKTAEAFAPDATPPVAAVLQSVSQVEKNADAHP